ncbi:hypothetical protein LXA43DRAFT_958016 [Ganoderma leucocontextum]|nr:hypothetical protein LXA43DRAFT_958016 [Ganoderma leucocontextum]
MSGQSTSFPHPHSVLTPATLQSHSQSTPHSMRLKFPSPVRVSAPGPIPGLRPPSPSTLRLPRMKPRYSDRRGYVRGHLREDVDNKLREVTGDDEAGMYWTLEDYIESVVLQHGIKLVGWPPDIPFQNLSNIRGGVSTLTHLGARSITILDDTSYPALQCTFIG